MNLVLMLIGIFILAVLITILKITTMASQRKNQADARSAAVNVEDKAMGESGQKPAQPSGPSDYSPAARDMAGTQGSVPVFPVLPANCSSCNAPLNMNTVKWTGPMSACCPNCGSAIEIKWKKLVE